MSSATILGVTGILVSGVIGPWVAYRGGARADRRRFERDEVQRRKDDLRLIVDEAAGLLSVGETNLRLANEAVERGDPEPNEVREWAGRVHVLHQRLLLRLPTGHPVTKGYRSVQDSLVAVAATYGGGDGYGDAVKEFEARRTSFLDVTRETLAEAPSE